MEEAENSKPTLTTIGKCTGCGRMKKVVAGKCDSCAGPLPSRMTPEKAELVERRIRTDPAFKRKCYELLTVPLAKEAFLRNYGPLE